MALKTFDAMARGGIRDHLAGGYHRYSTVRDWSIPHFEKMLYDNAQLAEALVLAYETTGDPRWKAEAEATFAFVARTMTAPDGLFYSALDAESEGEEGKSYLWTPAEVEKILGNGEDYALFAHVYALDGEPDLEDGRYVLLEPKVIDDPAVEARLVPLRAKLLAARNRRPAPSLDDKILTSWNALMIAAYAEGARVLKDDRYKLAAEKAADALLAHDDRPRRPALADRPRRQGQAPGLSRRLRLLDPRPGQAPRRHRRPEATGPGENPGRPDDRRLRRPQGRRFLLHRGRPRGPARQGQGPVRQRDPGGQ